MFLLQLSAVQSFCMAIGLEPLGVQKSEFNYFYLLHENLCKLHPKIWKVQYCAGCNIPCKLEIIDTENLVSEFQEINKDFKWLLPCLTVYPKFFFS
jgi:hypothetical protein